MKRGEAKKNLHSKFSPKAIVFFSLLLLIIIAILLSITKPERSISGFCSAFSEEKVRLSTLPGDSYPSGVFNEELSNAQEFADSFERLEKVSPEEIQADVATLQSLYTKIHEDPSQAIAASLSGIEPEENIKEWISSNCDLSI